MFVLLLVRFCLLVMLCVRICSVGLCVCLLMLCVVEGVVWV